MKRLLFLLILSFFSIQANAGSCSDGSDPVKSVSDDGTYFVFKCGGNNNKDKKTKEVEKKPVKTSSNTAKKTPSINGKPKALEMVSSLVGKFNIKKLSENSNQNVSAFSSITNKFDINQDGHDDLILGNTTLNIDGRNQLNEFSKPVILFWDNDTEEYIVDIEVQKTLPLLYFPRRIHGSINPTTGLTHLFIADTGLDLANYDFSSANLPPNCGAQNHLITYDPSSKKVTKILLPKLWDYTHALATADLNGDKITDYVVLNSPYIKYPQKCLFKGAEYTNGSYILYSNKNGSFDKVNIELNYKGYSKIPTITSAIVIVDDNKDTFLLLGSEDPGNSIYALKQESKNSFTETSRVSAPTIMNSNGKSGAYSEVLHADIDGDGTKEVVASVNNSNWTGRYIQLLNFNNGQLRDRSEDVVQSNPANNVSDWCHHLFFNEKTAWNKPILTCTNLTPTIKSRGYFYNWDENKLQPLKIKSKNKEPWEKEQLEKWVREIFPVTINQKNVYVGHGLTGERKVNGDSFYDIKEYYLIEPSKPPKKILAPSSTFDGSYDFKLSLTNPEGRSWSPGGGLIDIKNGVLNVSNKGRILRDVDSTIDKFDSFKGQVDKNGDFTATFEFNACGPGDCEEKLIALKGNINNNNKLSGIFLNKVIAFELTKKIDILKEKDKKTQSEENELFKNIKSSDALDGYYSFTLVQSPMTQLGGGSLEINNGIVTITQDSKGIVSPSYDSFEGRINKNGDIKAIFYFHLCSGCEDKLVEFDGNLNKKKLSGKYNDSQIYFYLTSKKGEVTKVKKEIIKVNAENKQTIEIAIPKNSRTWDYPFLAFDKYEAKGSKDYYQFKSNLKEDKDVLKDLKNNHKTGLISYLLFEDNKIVIDESDIPIKVQGDNIIDGLLPSHSMGKSLVSYVTGHAICEGYIKSVNERLTGWDVIENTLYNNQVLIDLLNMAAGDQEYIGERLGEEDNYLIKSKVNGNKIPLKKIMGSDLLNSKKSNPVYNYSALTTHVILNYVLHKSGDEILDKVFSDHVKVKNSVYFTKTPVVGNEQSARYSFYATRYDYLRIAKAMMDDWNSDNCVGKYLKTVYDRRILKNDNTKIPNSVGLYSQKYGGQFHFDMFGINKTRKILGMSGFAGQEILIDVDNEKIIVVNTLLKKYDWKKIVYERIKNVQPHSGAIKKIKEVIKVETKKVETSDSDPAVSKVIEVTHGDKLIVNIAEPHELAGSNIKISLKDIDTPDATRSCPKQLELGVKVRDYVAQKLENASSIKLTNFRKTNTKIIAQVVVDGVDLGEELVSKGYASKEYGHWKPYFCSALSATNQADQYRDTDEKKAIFWYERSIILDPDGSKNQESHFLLSKMYSNFGNADKSLENLKKSASLEWVPAMEELGSSYLNGSFVKKDSNQGKKWLKKAFDKGSQRAEDIYCGSLPKAKQKTCKF